MHEIVYGTTVVIYNLSICENFAYLRGTYYAVKHLWNKKSATR